MSFSFWSDFSLQDALPPAWNASLAQAPRLAATVPGAVSLAAGTDVNGSTRVL